MKNTMMPPHTGFNIVHIIPEKRSVSSHGLLGYQEVVETLHWGLTNIGCSVAMTTNSFDPVRTNIILGVQVLPEAEIARIPANSIIYNFEQIARMPVDQLKPEILTVAQRFRIWDYSAANVAAWNAIGTRYPVTLVPVGWAPLLARIESSVVQDIDALIYGMPGQLRLEVFYDLCLHGLKCVFLCGLYGSARDELIARSKVVLNINQHDSHIFEIVRVSYLLANAKAVVADAHDNMIVESDMKDAVLFCEPRDMVEQCRALLHNDGARRDLEVRGRSAIQARPISAILRVAVDGLPVM